MVCQDNELLLNNVFITLSRSFLQYVAEGSPWVRTEAAAIEQQLMVLAARQRQHAGEIVELLIAREFGIDFGSFPTEYTDLQFLSLEMLLQRLQVSMANIGNSLKTAAISLRSAGDTEGADLVTSIEIKEQDVARALTELQKDLKLTATA